jgi:hypothetical protein
MKTFVRPDACQKRLLHDKPTKRMCDEIYGAIWGHFALARIADCEGKALAIAVKALGARILHFFLESSDVGIVAIGDYSSFGKVVG